MDDRATTAAQSGTTLSPRAAPEVSDGLDRLATVASQLLDELDQLATQIAPVLREHGPEVATPTPDRLNTTDMGRTIEARIEQVALGVTIVRSLRDRCEL